MSMVVARMQKMKASNLVGIGNHNQRKTQNHSNEDIDMQRSHLNYDLVEGRTNNYKTDIEKFINEKKASQRATRKDAVLVNEWILTSDRPFFDKLDDKETERFFKDTKDFFADKFGDDNIRYAQVHLDERTPHMHLGIVPFDKDNKLSAKRMFDKKTLQAIQDELPKYLNERGFDLDRGQRGSERKHLSVPEYKKMADSKLELQNEINSLKENKTALEAEISPLKQEVDLKKGELRQLVHEYEPEITLKQIRATYETKQIEVESGEKNLFGKPLMTTKEVRTGNLVVKKEHFDMLLNTARQKEELEQKVNNYLKSDSVGMVNRMAAAQVDLQQKNEVLNKNLEKILVENLDLRQENTKLKLQVNYLKNEIENIYKHVKTFLKEHTPDLSTFKELFRGFVDEFKERSPKSHLSRIDQHEKNNEQSRGGRSR